MRLRAILFAALALAATGAASWRLAEAAAGYVERATGAQLAEALAAAGQDWARAEVDGLAVALTGAAPDETSRFRALEIVKQVVDARRVADRTTVSAAEALAPPPFALELLRNEDEVSLIGLVPAAGARDAIRAALDAGGLGDGVTDMLEVAEHPPPPGWAESLGFGLELLGALPRAKIGIEPGRVRVVAVAESDAARTELQSRLAAMAPEGVALALELSAPRPVIAPFAVDFTLADGAGRFAACSAESAEDAAAIIAAARLTGLARHAGCALGLGAPSPHWAAAVARGLAALRELGGGRFAIRDLEASLSGPEDVTPDALAAAGARLDADLPPELALTLVPPRRPETRGTGARIYAPRFYAYLGADGGVRLAGPLQDAASQAAVESYAAALFGHDRVADATVVDPRLPEGWPGRVLAGIDALSALKAGRLTVTAEAVTVEGSAIDADADAQLEAMLADKIGEGVVVKVRFDADAAAAAASAARSKPEVCAEEIGAVLAAGSIRFGLGSADIEPVSRGVIAAIADVLRECPGAAFEIGGHTDSRGSAAANQRLSEDRARAVQAALEAQDLPLVRLAARGYGAARPLGDNATDAGRASNRRIAFTLITPEAAAAAKAAEDGRARAEACAAAIAARLGEDAIEFAPGSADIVEASRGTVAAIALALATCPGAVFEIGGYTDDRGDAEANRALSAARAEAVRAALEADELPVTLSARGHGEDRPVADNASEEGRARNRRIAFTLLAAGPIEPQPGPQAAVDAASPPPPAPDPRSAGAACAAGVAEILDAESIAFEFGSADIAPASLEVVARLAEVLQSCPGAAFEIGGYTDSQGADEANLRLSAERAEAVMAALKAAEVPVTLAARGHGEADPVADNATEEGRARNRRIALTLLAPPAEGSDAGEADPGDGPR